jgi:hypothetical protein
MATLLNRAPKVSNYLTKRLNWRQKIKTLSQTILTNDNCSGFITLRIGNLKTLLTPKLNAITRM